MPQTGGLPAASVERARLVAHLAAYLREWQQLLAGPFSAHDPRLASVQHVGREIAQRAQAIGFGGIGHHVADCVRLVDGGSHDADGLRARLRTISEMAWQVRHELTADEQALVQQLQGGGLAAAPAGPSVAPAAAAPAPAAQGLAPPRMVTMHRPSPLASGPATGAPPPAAAPPSYAPPGHGTGSQPPFLQPPPPLSPAGPGPAYDAGRPSAAPPMLGGPDVGRPSHAPAPPGLSGPASLPPVMAPPSMAPHGPPSVNPMGSASSSLPPMAPSGGSAGGMPAPAAGPRMPSDVPQFPVRPMLGLRGFGPGGAPSTEAPVSAMPSQAPGSAPAPSLLGLRARSGAHSVAPAPPPLMHDASGLPPLGTEQPNRGSSEKAELQQVLSRIGRGSASASSSSSKPARKRRPSGATSRVPRENPRPTWLLAGIAAAGVAGLALIAYLTLWRSRPDTTQPAVATTGGQAAPAASPGSPPAAGAANTPSEMPRERLLADDERFKALLTQVHGRGGKESPELRALLNEQAALASKALTLKCEQPGPSCNAWKETRELLVNDGSGKKIVKRRERNPDQRPSRWLIGLKLPSIPIEDDPRVQRVFEYYTESAVGRETLQSMLFRCGAYRDLIQSTLIRHDLPADLLALVFTESGCEPMAKSPVGAAGLWQLMPETARAYHLHVKEGSVDERHSPTKSTEAAVKFLSDMRQKLGSWDLVFAGYNMGPFGLLARVTRAGGDVGFWDLVDADLLPDETTNYAPTVQAFALILNNLQRLKLAGAQVRAPQLTADLEVPAGTRLGLVSRAAATSMTVLRSLNRDITGDSVPQVPGRRFNVQVPKDVVWQARDSLQALLANDDHADECVPPTFDWGKQRFTPEMEKACPKRSGASKPAP